MSLNLEQLLSIKPPLAIESKYPATVLEAGDITKGKGKAIYWMLHGGKDPTDEPRESADKTDPLLEKVLAFLEGAEAPENLDSFKTPGQTVEGQQDEVIVLPKPPTTEANSAPIEIGNSAIEKPKGERLEPDTDNLPTPEGSGALNLLPTEKALEFLEGGNPAMPFGNTYNSGGKTTEGARDLVLEPRQRYNFGLTTIFPATAKQVTRKLHPFSR